MFWSESVIQKGKKEWGKELVCPKREEEKRERESNEMEEDREMAGNHGIGILLKSGTKTWAEGHHIHDIHR